MNVIMSDVSHIHNMKQTMPIILIKKINYHIGWEKLNEWESAVRILKFVDGVIHLNLRHMQDDVKSVLDSGLVLFCSFNDVIHHFGNIDFVFIAMDPLALEEAFDLNDNRFNNSELHFLPLTLQIPLPYTLPSIEGKEQLIPKKIHYGWFGGDKKPPLVEYCIQSWYKHHPGWEIIEWNEHNIDDDLYDPESIKSEEEFYNNEDPNIFNWRNHHIMAISRFCDRLRGDLVKRYGGIYMDTDMEVIKPLDRFLYTPSFLTLYSIFYIDWNVAGSMINPDNNNILNDFGIYNRWISLGINTLARFGDNGVVYPTDVFTAHDQHHSAFEYLTENTHAIHHRAKGWMNRENRIKTIKLTIEHRNIIKKVFGNSILTIPHHLLGITRREPDMQEIAKEYTTKGTDTGSTCPSACYTVCRVQ